MRPLRTKLGFSLRNKVLCILHSLCTTLDLQRNSCFLGSGKDHFLCVSAGRSSDRGGCVRRRPSYHGGGGGEEGARSNFFGHSHLSPSPSFGFLWVCPGEEAKLLGPRSAPSSCQEERKEGRRTNHGDSLPEKRGRRGRSLIPRSYISSLACVEEEKME